MKKIVLLLLVLLPVLSARAQAPFAKYLSQVDSAPFIVVDKPSLTLTLVDASGYPIKEYGCALARNFGPKQVRGDNKTPEVPEASPTISGMARAPSGMLTAPGSSAWTFPASVISAFTALLSRRASAPAPPRVACA